MDARLQLEQLLYKSPPSMDITLDELHEAGEQRIRLLEACSSPSHSGAPEAFLALEPECKELLWRRTIDTLPVAWRSEQPVSGASDSPDPSGDRAVAAPRPSMPTRLSVVERDVVSHCALRLALCGEDEPHTVGERRQFYAHAHKMRMRAKDDCTAKGGKKRKHFGS